MTANHLTEDILSFERRSGRYEHSLSQFFVFDRVHKAALDLIPQGLNPVNILDIGCGTGRLLRKAADRWPRASLTGVDPAEGMITEAHCLTPDAKFLVSTAEDISLPANAFDLVVSTMSFHHWADQRRALQQIADILVCGGYFLLADQVPPYGLDRIIHHGRPADFPQRRALFEPAGLQVRVEKKIMAGFVLITLARMNR